MPPGIDDIISAPDKPDISIGIDTGSISRVVKTASKLLLINLFVIQIVDKHRRPSGLQAEIPLLPCRPRPPLLVQNRNIYPVNRLAHRSGTNLQPGPVADHDATGFGLEPGIVNLESKNTPAPVNNLGVERFANAVYRPQG